MARHRAYRMALCHPDLPHYAKGKCRACYFAARWNEVLADASAPKRTKRMGVTRLGEIPPSSIAGVLQHRIIVDPDKPIDGQLPARCDNCGNQRIARNGREVACRGVFGGCGKTWFLVAGEPIAATVLTERHRQPPRRRVA